MECVVCGLDTGIERTVTTGTRVERHRICIREPPHRFRTLETVPVQIEEIAVRRASNRAIIRPFSRGKLHDDLRAALMLGLEQEEVRGATTVADLVDGVVRRLVAETAWHRPVDSEDRRRLVEAAGEERRAAAERLRIAVRDRDVVRLVDEQLRAHGFEVQRILYALTVQHDYGSRTVRWKGARDALGWIARTFPEVRRDIPAPGLPAHRYSWAPSSTVVAMPERVVKRDRRIQEFDWTKLLHAVELTFQGRSSQAAIVEAVARWTVLGLGGQRTVSTQQLSAGVLGCLRRVDDIAYLRCSIAVKGLSSAAAVADEAEDLLLHPADELRFTPPPVMDTDPARPHGDVELLER